MSKTEKLFYLDPHQRDFTATIVDVASAGVVLDKTAFYPQGGYQESDSGRIVAGERVADVFQVSEQNGIVYHKVRPERELRVGETVQGVIDWERRVYLSTLHSAQHVLSKIILNLYKLHTVRSSFSMTGGMVVLSSKFKNEWLEETESAFLELAERAVPIERIIAGEHISIRIGDFDEAPCGGTHLGATSDLRDVYLLGTDEGKLIFDGGTIGRKRLRDYGRKLFLIRKMYNFPDEIVRTVEETIDNHNAMSGQMEKYRLDAFLGMLADESGVREMGGARVSVIIDGELDSKVVKKALGMKGLRTSADLYIIGVGSKMVVYSLSDRLKANALCSDILKARGFQGGGNVKRFDMSIGSANPADVAAEITAGIK